MIQANPATAIGPGLDAAVLQAVSCSPDDRLDVHRRARLGQRHERSLDPLPILADALSEVSGKAPGVPIRRRVVEGHPANVLVRAARGADLLVVGSRGHAGFAGALLGSVSQHCVHCAPCPVLVIRETSGHGR